MLILNALLLILMFEEGFVDHVYKDRLGHETVGYGFLVYEGDKRNYTKEEAELELSYRVVDLISDVAEDERLSKAFFATDHRGRMVMVLMAYQMGVNGLAEFKGFLSALEAGDTRLAQYEMLDSLWAKQTPGRSKRTALLLDAHYMEIYKGKL